MNPTDPSSFTLRDCIEDPWWGLTGQLTILAFMRRCELCRLNDKVVTGCDVVTD